MQLDRNIVLPRPQTTGIERVLEISDALGGGRFVLELDPDLESLGLRRDLDLVPGEVLRNIRSPERLGVRVRVLLELDETVEPDDLEK